MIRCFHEMRGSDREFRFGFLNSFHREPSPGFSSDPGQQAPEGSFSGIRPQGSK